MNDHDTKVSQIQPTWLNPLKGHTKSIQCLELEEKNNILASGSDDKTVRIWDLNTFKSIRCLVGFQHPVNSVAFDPVGTNLVFAASGNSLFYFDLRKPSVILSEHEQVTFNTDEINQISTKGSFISLCDDSGEIKILKLDSTNECNKIDLYKTLRKQHSNICTSVRFHPKKDGEVISGGLDGKVILWDFQKLKQLLSFDMIEKNNSNQVVNPAFVFALDVSSADQPLIAAGLGDHSIAVLSTKLKKKIASLEQHTSSVSQVLFAPFDEKFLISGGNDSKIVLWKLGDESILTNPKNKKKFETEIVYSIQHESKINWMKCDKNKRLFVADQTNSITSLQMEC